MAGLALLDVVASFAFGGLSVLTVVLATTTFHAGEEATGYLNAAIGVGGLVGGGRVGCAHAPAEPRAAAPRRVGPPRGRVRRARRRRFDRAGPHRDDRRLGRQPARRGRGRDDLPAGRPGRAARSGARASSPRSRRWPTPAGRSSCRSWPDAIGIGPVLAGCGVARRSSPPSWRSSRSARPRGGPRTRTRRSSATWPACRSSPGSPRPGSRRSSGGDGCATSRPARRSSARATQPDRFAVIVTGRFDVTRLEPGAAAPVAPADDGPGRGLRGDRAAHRRAPDRDRDRGHRRPAPRARGRRLPGARRRPVRAWRTGSSTSIGAAGRRRGPAARRVSGT